MKIRYLLLAGVFLLAGLPVSCGEAKGTAVQPQDPAPPKTKKVTINGAPVFLIDDSSYAEYPGGSPKKGTLASDTLIDTGISTTLDTGAMKVQLAGGKEAGFYPDKTLNWGYLAEKTQVYGYNLRAERIEFYPGGKVMNAYLEKGAQICGYSPVDDYPVFFHESGSLKLILPKHNLKTGGIEFQSNTMVSFYDSGAPARGILAKDTEIDGLILKGGTALMLYPDGTIMMGTLAKPAAVKNKKFAAGDEIKFDLLGQTEK
ncbi:MAG: hypothetical protein A2Y33_00240 [Spirochaetes bacterium GWF1_51_8]|nr:MAG: hypothetical protein A2Y33_00240 [Spirochaetes bacterium GWF1_51_8]